MEMVCALLICAAAMRGEDVEVIHLVLLREAMSLKE
jgi:hypothetical protein